MGLEFGFADFKIGIDFKLYKPQALYTSDLFQYYSSKVISLMD